MTKVKKQAMAGITGPKLDEIARAMCVADGFNPDQKCYAMMYHGSSEAPQNETSIPVIFKYRHFAMIAAKLLTHPEKS